MTKEHQEWLDARAVATAYRRKPDLKKVSTEELLAEIARRSQPKKMKTVRNLMSGKEIQIPADTPLCCDPSSETYWSM